jgi:iron complex transport system substrate-binding protein
LKLVGLRSLLWWLVTAALSLSTLGLIVACQVDLPRPALEVAACMQTEHFGGTACVPVSSERLVTLDVATFEFAIAAGLSPIATAFSDLADHMADRMAMVENVGLAGEPNLEQVLALKPDLIVGLESSQGAYALAEMIAPTLMFPFVHSGQWKSAFKQFSMALGRTHAADQVMTDYERRLAQFKTQMDLGAASWRQDDPSALQVSVVRIYPDAVNLYLRDSFCGTVLQDAGLARPPAQDIGADEAKALFSNQIQVRISREQLELADGDVIFVWTGESSSAASNKAQEQLEELQQDPLWRKLKAVQAGRVYTVPSYWIGSGPIAANAILDDLFTNLIPPS